MFGVRRSSPLCIFSPTYNPKRRRSPHSKLPNINIQRETWSVGLFALEPLTPPSLFVLHPMSGSQLDEFVKNALFQLPQRLMQFLKLLGAQGLSKREHGPASKRGPAQGT